MIKNASQILLNQDTSSFSYTDINYQKNNQGNSNAYLNSSKNSSEQTFDNLNIYSAANEISLQKSQMSARLHNIRQKSLDFQMFHQNSPQVGLSINSERLSFQNNTLQYGYCSKHPNRKAKYYVSEDSTNLFCSKCALGSALKGKKIEQVFASEEKFRKAETDTFMKNLKLTQNILNLSDTENEKGKERVKEFYEIQLKKINEAFNHVESMLVEERNKIVQKIHQSMNESLKQIDDYKMKIKLFKFEASQQERDISNHYDNIISQMENQPFTEILKNYNEKLSQIQDSLNSINASKISVVQIADKSDLQKIQKILENSIVYLSDYEMDIFEKQIYEEYLSICSQIQIKKSERPLSYQNSNSSYIQDQVKHQKNNSCQLNQSNDITKLIKHFGERKESYESFEIASQNSYLLKTEQSDCASTNSLKQQKLLVNHINRNKTITECKFIRPQNSQNSSRCFEVQNTQSKSSNTSNRSLLSIEQQQQQQYKIESKITNEKQENQQKQENINKNIVSKQQAPYINLENIDKYKRINYNMNQSNNSNKLQKSSSSIEKRLVKKNIPQVNIDFRVLGTNLTNSYNNQK
ncbi:hypothetical protein TTHERM_000086999 (macronuclear) [Tetrahymena thermophila SB210]|uniref:Uncharacterized protein n=1 Tax=Tetrahymena thermophila (strain SB210) TaxID=312017 RepID=W7XKT8_TETTS|nr:hypothetical protein TTHERM_000086999 [Tetrahymena thermophila SB210]EWS75214.1 hypothetical protein TTHERM_000086999 [Tetrahymena thermophila SB210]|eukprot:XP_012652205.1 hypothetical protein TTHERM_000086999 [Tetrahymena thermophila SB210]